MSRDFSDDDIVEEIISELRRCSLLADLPRCVREVRTSVWRVRQQGWMPPAAVKKMKKIRQALRVLTKELPHVAPRLPWVEPPARMDGAAYHCGSEAFDLIELLCAEAPTSAEELGPFRSITNLLLLAASIESGSRNICYEILRRRHSVPRNTPNPS